MKFPLSGSGWIAAAISFPAALFAADLVYEPFAYSAGIEVTGELGGQGWLGAWTQEGQSGMVRSEGLNYFDRSGNVLETSGSSLDTSNIATSRNFRNLDGVRSDVWVSFLYHLPRTNAKFEGLTFYRGAKELFSVSNSSVNPGPEISFGNSLTGAAVNTRKGQFGATHLVVLKVIGGNASEPGGSVEIFVDPLLSGVPSIADGVIHAVDFSFDRIRVAAQDGSSLFVDELRIGQSFAAVSPHAAVPGIDSDHDGLTDAEEVLLGLDPFRSDLKLIDGIKANPALFQLHDESGILALGNGGVVIPKSGDQAVEFQFEVQQSSNLVDWTELETYIRTISLPNGKNFLRVTSTEPFHP